MPPSPSTPVTRYWPITRPLIACHDISGLLEPHIRIARNNDPPHRESHRLTIWPHLDVARCVEQIAQLSRLRRSLRSLTGSYVCYSNLACADSGLSRSPAQYLHWNSSQAGRLCRPMHPEMLSPGCRISGSVYG